MVGGNVDIVSIQLRCLRRRMKMPENKPKYNYQTMAQISYQPDSNTNIHITINGIGDTCEEAITLFDHALKRFSEFFEGATRVKLDEQLDD